MATRRPTASNRQRSTWPARASAKRTSPARRSGLGRTASSAVRLRQRLSARFDAGLQVEPDGRVDERGVVGRGHHQADVAAELRAGSEQSGRKGCAELSVSPRR